ncbi:MAG: oligosaccharide flippase family protein [Pararhodobacter sp.]|nr:oligosaccharide flippase family protein [Pararhodobacter sp.]
MFWTVSGQFGAEGMRLAANLVLTRLLFPEAFGLMALIIAVMVGLQMFSDIGIAPSIQQNRRADEPAFLDTAWTIQVIRGVVLWLAAAALALPLAAFYGAPELAQLLPVAALSLIVAGFRPTRFETASRHLRIGRATVINLSAQALGLAITITLAWITRSVWALAAGMVIAEALRVLALHVFMPGHVDRLRIERASARELIAFGKWIFLSTLCAFAIAQGDRLILGHYLTLEFLGIFSIGYFIAIFPRMLGMTAMERLMIPIYRERPPAESAANFRALRQMRALFTAGLMGLVTALALGGPWLIELLYDPRYMAAGPVVVLVSLGVLLQLVGMTYDRAALAAGDARGFFGLQAWRAVLQTGFFIAGAELAGLGGALIGQALSVVAVYGVQLRLARRHGAWDARHDVLAIPAALGLGALALWLHLDLVATLFAATGN